MSNILGLLDDMKTTSKRHLHGLLYANVITALECYLSDFFVSQIKAAQALLRKFIETTPAFKEQKIAVSDVFQTMDAIEQRANTYLAGLVWHRLDRVKSLYENTLGVKFPSDLRSVLGAIVIRHELVHRNGKREDATEHYGNGALPAIGHQLPILRAPLGRLRHAVGTGNRSWRLTLWRGRVVQYRDVQRCSW